MENCSLFIKDYFRHKRKLAIVFNQFINLFHKNKNHTAVFKTIHSKIWTGESDMGKIR